MQTIKQYAETARQYVGQCVESGKKGCTSLLNSCASSTKIILDINQGTLCIFLVQYFVKDVTPSLSLQWSLTFGIAALVNKIATEKFDILKQEKHENSIGAYRNPAFYRNMAKTLVLLAAGCAISACVMSNPLLLQLAPRIMAVQTIFSFCFRTTGNITPGAFFI